VNDAAALPPVWAKFAKVAPKPWSVSADDITAHRTEWLRQWRDLTSR
jgi:thiamine transport system substrate-binding protein